jgi:uncharacterized protein YndB with AHSA1/START domain
MDNFKFIYVTYIASSPEKLWDALINPAMTTKYWQHVNLSDWKPGSKWEHRSADDEHALHLTGNVIEFVPAKKLVLSWVFPANYTNENMHSQVTLDIEPYKNVVRLIITHDKLEHDSDMFEGIIKGWPIVISSLKSLLETGQALPKLW